MSVSTDHVLHIEVRAHDDVVMADQNSRAYHPYLYPFLGIYKLLTDFNVSRPILYSTTIALIQSAIITLGYTYISFKYVHWFVTHHLLNFSYFNLRPLFGWIEYGTRRRMSTQNMEWYTAALLTLFQAAVLSNALVGYKLRVQGIKAGSTLLASRPRKQLVVTEEKKSSGGLLYRLVKGAIWTTFITPVYAIPGLGQALYIFLRAPSITRTYLDMFAATQYSTYKVSSIAFGVPAGLLQSVPFVGHFFVITNCVGMAMWIQDLEG